MRSLVLLGVMFYMMFSVTSHAGAVAAEDASVDFEEMRDTVTSNLTDLQHETAQNLTKAERKTFGQVYNSTFIAASKLAYHGMNVGGDYPTASKANAAVAPWALMGVLLWYVRRAISKARR